MVIIACWQCSKDELLNFHGKSAYCPHIVVIIVSGQCCKQSIVGVVIHGKCAYCGYCCLWAILLAMHCGQCHSWKTCILSQYFIYYCLWAMLQQENGWFGLLQIVRSANKSNNATLGAIIQLLLKIGHFGPI